MPTVERHDGRSLLQKARERDEPAVLIGEHEIRHRLARLRRLLAGAGLLQARNHVIDDAGKLRIERTHVVGERLSRAPSGASMLRQRSVLSSSLSANVFSAIIGSGIKHREQPQAT